MAIANMGYVIGYNNGFSHTMTETNHKIVAAKIKGLNCLWEKREIPTKGLIVAG